MAYQAARPGDGHAQFIAWPGAAIAATWMAMMGLGRRIGQPRDWRQWAWLVLPGIPAALLSRRVAGSARMLAIAPTRELLHAYGLGASVLVGVYLVWIVGFPVEALWLPGNKAQRAALRLAFAISASLLLCLVGFRMLELVGSRNPAHALAKVRESIDWTGSSNLMVLGFLLVRALVAPVFAAKQRRQHAAPG